MVIHNLQIPCLDRRLGLLGLQSHNVAQLALEGPNQVSMVIKLKADGLHHRSLVTAGLQFQHRQIPQPFHLQHRQIQPLRLVRCRHRRRLATDADLVGPAHIPHHMGTGEHVNSTAAAANDEAGAEAVVIAILASN